MFDWLEWFQVITSMALIHIAAFSVYLKLKERMLRNCGVRQDKLEEEIEQLTAVGFTSYPVEEAAELLKENFLRRRWAKRHCQRIE